MKILKEKRSNIEFDILSELYPDYKIDVDKEQEKLLKADIIVLQYPVFWYSMPSLLEKWMEDVFVHSLSKNIISNLIIKTSLLCYNNFRGV